MNPLIHDRMNVVLLATALAGLASGAGLVLAGEPDLATVAWAAGVIPVLSALLGLNLPLRIGAQQQARKYKNPKKRIF